MKTLNLKSKVRMPALRSIKVQTIHQDAWTFLSENGYKLYHAFISGANQNLTFEEDLKFYEVSRKEWFEAFNYAGKIINSRTHYGIDKT